MARNLRKKKSNQFPMPNRRPESVTKKPGDVTPHGMMDIEIGEGVQPKLHDGEEVFRNPYKGKGLRRRYKKVHY